MQLEREAVELYRMIRWFDAELRVGGPLKAEPYRAPLRVPFGQGSRGKASSRPAAGGGAALPGLDEEDDLGLGDLDEAPPAREKLADRPGAVERGHDLRAMRFHVASMVDAIRVAGGVVPGQVCKELPTTDDSLFGPWYGLGPLGSSAGAPNRLPAVAAASRPQEWRTVGRWRILGPEPEPNPARETSYLPPTFFNERTTYRAVARYIPVPPPDAEDVKRIDASKAVTSWTPCPIETKTGYIRPPSWWRGASGYSPGVANSSWRAATEIDSAVEQDVWIAAATDSDCRLWINNRLVAAWPEGSRPFTYENMVMFKVRLRKGKNSLLAHVGQPFPGSRLTSNAGIWVRVCLRGAPDPSVAKSFASSITPRARELKAIGPNVRGYPGVGKPIAGDARPVTAWDIDTGRNVLWRVGLSHATSTPVVAGDLVFTTSYPYYLIAIDRKTGAVRWREPVHIIELLKPDAAGEARKVWDRYLDLAQKVYSGAVDVKTISGFGSMQFRDGDENLIGPAALQRLQELAGKGIRIAGAVAGRAALDPRRDPVESTPVTDGKYVWVWNACGAAACYGLDGRRHWMVQTPHDPGKSTGLSSPTLVDGKLILVVALKGGKGNAVLALDAATGKQLWQTPGIRACTPATPAALRITNGEDEMSVLVTGGACFVGAPAGKGLPRPHVVCGGAVIRVDDGKVLLENMSVTSAGGTPVASGDVVYHFGRGMNTATRLLMLDRDGVGVMRLWTRKAYEGRGGTTVIPLGEALHANRPEPRNFAGTDVGYGAYSADNGALLSRMHGVDLWTAVGGGGGRYAPAVMAGGYLYCAYGMPHANKYRTTHTGASVVDLNAGGRIIARNKLPKRTASCLAVDGERVYYRNYYGLVCLGRDGDLGDTYEAEENAKCIIESFPVKPDPKADTVAIVPEKRLHPSLPRQDLWGRPLQPYVTLGVYEKDVREALLAALTGKARARIVLTDGSINGAHFKAGGVSHTMRAQLSNFLAWVNLPGRGGVSLIDPLAGNRGFNNSENSTVYYYTVMISEIEQTVRFHSVTENPGVSVWLGGVRVNHGGRYRLGKGEYTLLIEFKRGPRERTVDLCGNFYFVPAASTPADDLAAYRHDLEQIRPYLARAIKLSPDSDVARLAKRFLDEPERVIAERKEESKTDRRLLIYGSTRKEAYPQLREYFERVHGFPQDTWCNRFASLAYVQKGRMNDEAPMGLDGNSRERPLMIAPDFLAFEKEVRKIPLPTAYIDAVLKDIGSHHLVPVRQFKPGFGVKKWTTLLKSVPADARMVTIENGNALQAAIEKEYPEFAGLNWLQKALVYRGLAELNPAMRLRGVRYISGDATPGIVRADIPPEPEEKQMQDIFYSIDPEVRVVPDSDGAPLQGITLTIPVGHSRFKVYRYQVPAGVAYLLPPRDYLRRLARPDSLRLVNEGLEDAALLRGQDPVRLDLRGNDISDLLFLRSFSRLRELRLDSNPVKDLSPLSKLPLQRLDLAYTPVADLSPLSGLSLTRLDLRHTPAGSLAPIAGMPLKYLDLSGSSASGLAALKKMPLEYLDLNVDGNYPAGFGLLKQIRGLKTVGDVDIDLWVQAHEWRKKRGLSEAESDCD